MVRFFTAEEDAKIQLLYEQGKQFKEIAGELLERNTRGVADRYKTLLKNFKKRLDKDIQLGISYIDPDEPTGEISAEEWAAKQEARVKSTWKHGGLPPSSMYTILPSWPESNAESSSNSASQKPAKSARAPPTQLSSSSSEDEESVIEEPKPIAKEPESIAEVPKSIVENPKSIAEEPKSADYEKLIEQVQTAHKSVLRALESSEAKVAEQKSLAEYYKSQAGHQDRQVKETEAEKGLAEQKILVDHYKAQAEQHKRRVEEVEAEKKAWMEEKSKLLEEVHQFDRQNSVYERRLDGMGAEVIEAIALLSDGEVDKAIDLLTGTKRRRIE